MKHALLAFTLLFLSITVSAQVAVNQDGMPADSSAMLDVRSTAKGMLIPRMSSAQREMIAIPATGLLVFDMNTTSFWFYNGMAWTELVSDVTVPDKISDADNDTHVEVEQNPDEDRIRFTVGGTEYFRMDTGRLEVSNTGGSVLVGRGAGLHEDLSERYSVAIGDSAMHYSGAGTQYYHSVFNTAVGSRSLLYNTTGFYNTAVGGHTLRNNTTGHRNTALGVFALQSNIGGAHNTAVGMEALNTNVSGENNTALGFRAGYNSTGTGNVFLGRHAGYPETGSGKLYIDNSATSTPLIYGDFTTDSLVVHGRLAFTAEGNGPATGVVARDSHSVLQHMSYGRLIDSLAAHGLTGGGAGDQDWLDAGGLIPMTNTSHIYHEDSVTIGMNAPAGTGILNIRGRIDVSSVMDVTSVAVGSEALHSATSGTQNTAIGYRTLAGNMTGAGNTALGFSAMYSNTTGYLNTAHGSNALYSNTTGYLNAAMGNYSMYANTTGYQNAATGSFTLHFNTVGYGNTAHGYSALYSNKAGRYATAVGYRAQFYANDQTGPYFNYNVALGYEALRGSVIASANTGNYNTAVGSHALLNNTTGSQNTAHGLNALFSNTSGSNNTAVGMQALQANTTANFNTATGNYTLFYNTTGGNNTALGSHSMYLNTTGSYNSAVGKNSLRNNITGQYNAAFGYETLYRNTIANGNTATGSYALYSNTTGDNNNATGYGALYFNSIGSYNCAYGTDALYENNDSFNTAVGVWALGATDSSQYNVAVGYYAGLAYDNGSDNVFVGTFADATGPNFSNVVALGFDAKCTGSNQARIGNASTMSIGGYADWTMISDGRFKKTIRENVSGLEFITRLRPVTYQLDITGLRQFLHEETSKGSDPMTRDAIAEKEKIVQSGFIAQEVEKAAAASGFTFSGLDAARSADDLYGLRYAQFVVPLVKAVQELNDEVEKLKAQVRELEMERERRKKLK